MDDLEKLQSQYVIDNTNHYHIIIMITLFDRIIDNLPAIMNTTANGNNEQYDIINQQIQLGYPLGFISNNTYYINNHVDLILHVHNYNQHYRIVEFELIPSSVTYCNDSLSVQQSQSSAQQSQSSTQQSQSLVPNIVFSYSVIFKPNQHKVIGSRWDLYKHLGREKVHWLSLLNAFQVFLYLSIVLFYIFKTKFNRQLNSIQGYSLPDQEQEQPNQYHWKQISQHILKPPSYKLLYTLILQQGLQSLIVLLSILVLIMIGFINQNKRGELLTVFILMNAMLSVLPSYYAASFYRQIQGSSLLTLIVMLNLAPFVIIAIMFLTNLLFILENSNLFDNLTLVTLSLKTLLFLVPANTISIFIAFRRTSPPILHNESQNPRIPTMPVYLQIPNILISGLLPFAAISVEAYFILNSIWNHNFYYLFLFLLAILSLFIVICGQLSLLLVFLVISNNNHQWWIYSIVPGSCGIYLYIFAVFYFFKYLAISRLTTILLYFLYMLVISLYVSFISAATGIFIAHNFIKYIHSLIKLQ